MTSYYGTPSSASNGGWGGRRTVRNEPCSSSRDQPPTWRWLPSCCLLYLFLSVLFCCFGNICNQFSSLFIRGGSLRCITVGVLQKKAVGSCRVAFETKRGKRAAVSLEFQPAKLNSSRPTHRTAPPKKATNRLRCVKKKQKKPASASYLRYLIMSDDTVFGKKFTLLTKTAELRPSILNSSLVSVASPTSPGRDILPPTLSINCENNRTSWQELASYMSNASPLSLIRSPNAIFTCTVSWSLKR